MNDIKTSLYKEHSELGAKIISFAGYLMPVNYKEGLAKEYNVDYLILVGQGKNSGNFLLIDNKQQVKGQYSSYIFPENLLIRDSGSIVESFQLFRRVFIL